MPQLEESVFNSKSLRMAILCFLLSLSLYPCLGHAASGYLDTAFGSDGIVTTAIGSNNEEAFALTIQSDGMPVVVGYANTGAAGDFAVLRYDSTGTLDPSFGTDGIVTTAIGTNDEASSLAIQSDGKIVVAGISFIGINYDFAVVRYNSDGSLDTSFGTNGIVTTNIANHHDEARAVKIQSDGKIVAAGFARVGGIDDFAVVRYNSDGSLDASFSNAGIGIEITDIAGDDDRAFALGIQSDGKIVVAGYGTIATEDFAVVRYNSNGSLDTSFGTNGTGIETTDIGGGDDQAYALEIQSDGMIVVVGFAGIGGANNFALVRYNSNGSLDTSFGTNGIVTTTIGDNNEAFALGIQPDGRILVAGYMTTGGIDNFALVRYDSDGTPDTTFGTDGITTTTMGSGGGQAYALGIQSDGNIVVAGYATETSRDIALARYVGIAADLSITKEASATSATVRNNITYTIVVTNNGPDAASGVIMTDNLSSLLTFVSAETTQGTCSTEIPVTCDLGDLENGATATITLVATANGEGDAENTSSVTSQVSDPDTSNNSASTTTTVSVIEEVAAGGATCALSWHGHKQNEWAVVLALLFLPVLLIALGYRIPSSRRRVSVTAH